uniref:Uncharacterized protein n=1 Tax=Ganoderma boninense TaxID=34458 RepID=A0A5K1K4X8_9APHY|nr:Listeriolysin positive regulatory factor A (Listeriolysin positive regulatory protein) (Listeriolysin transcriptional regulator PrfA) (Pleitrophic regulatory factor A) (Positive regulatory factor A) (PrfA) (Virulence regulatory factor PrfA / Transcriptional regulator, CrP/Fnr family) [Ganoderma boninense]
MSTRTTRKRARTESEEVPKQEPEADLEATNTAIRADSDSESANPPQNNHGDKGKDKARALQRDPEFWFSDGTIILVAQAVDSASTGVC